MSKMDDAEKIARMTEWNEHETWEYSDNDEHSATNNLAAAKRFLAAQSFILSWQEGKVATGCRRARRLADFDGEYPQSVVDRAEDFIAERIAVKNMEKTARLNAAMSMKGKASDPKAKGKEKEEGGDDVVLSRKELDSLKSDFSAFSNDFFETKSALSKATTAVADISFRLQALSEILKSKPEE